MRFRSALSLVESKVASAYPSRQSTFFLHVLGFEIHVTRPDKGLLADERDTMGTR